MKEASGPWRWVDSLRRGARSRSSRDPGRGWAAHGITVGRVGGENQDAAAWSPAGPRRALAWGIVADGQGGRPGGAAAAQTAVRAAGAYLLNLAYLPSAEELRALGRVCDDRVRDEAGAGFTTLCLAVVSEGRARVLRCGDSRAYLLKPDRGESCLNPMAPSAPRLPVLGSGHARFAVDDRRLAAGQLLLLCTDGLFDVLPEPEVIAVLRDPAVEPANALLETARCRAPGGFSDDLTAVTLVPVTGFELRVEG